MIQQAQPDRPRSAAARSRPTDELRSRTFTQATIPAGYARFLLSQMFEPWASEMLARATLHPGDAVLDVASGLCPVARLAAAAVGRPGRGVASGLRPAKHALAAAPPTQPHPPPSEYSE